MSQDKTEAEIKRAEYHKKWVEDNKEKVRLYKQQYEKNNRDKLNKYCRDNRWKKKWWWRKSSTSCNKSYK